jgi:predicted acylesterase/phospholipase RssA
MAKVVRLDEHSTQTPELRRPKGRTRGSKTALVLGGGGFTGGVYEIGALRALDLLTVNRTVGEFDIYVGTSAGSFVASLVANGVSPDEMMRVVNSLSVPPFRDVDRSSLMRTDYFQLLKTAASLPLRLAGIAATLARDVRSCTLMDLVVEIAEAFPPGMYDSSGIQRYLADVLTQGGRSDDFKQLAAELYITATDLDTCERVIFGAQTGHEVAISQAVAASIALPMVYRPVDIAGRALVDGGVRSTTNVDIAVEEGARFVIVVNPLVPYVNDFQKRVPTLAGSRLRRVADMGFPRIGYQAFKLLAHQRLHEAVRHWKEKYPGVDIILIEPEPNDELMFETNIMNFAKRVEIARHGFESVTLKLANDFDNLRDVCARHGIEISPSRVHDVIQDVANEREKTSAWRQILEQTTGALVANRNRPR